MKKITKIGSFALLTPLLFLGGAKGINALDNSNNQISHSEAAYSSTRATDVHVTTWGEFKAAAENPSVTDIYLDNDIDLTGVDSAQYIPTMSDKTIHGQGYSFTNRELDGAIDDTDYLIGQATDVKIVDTSFENVEFFINNYEYTQTSDNDYALENVYIKNMTLSGQTITGNEGLFFNNVTINEPATDSDDNTVISNVAIQDSLVENVVVQDPSGSLNFLASNFYLKGATLGERSGAIESLSFSDNVVADSESILKTTIIGNYDTTYTTGGSTTSESIVLVDTLVDNNEMNSTFSVVDLATSSLQTSIITHALFFDNNLVSNDPQYLISAANTLTITGGNNNIDDLYLINENSNYNSLIQNQVGTEFDNTYQVQYANESDALIGALNSIFSDIYGVQNYYLKFDENGNLEDIIVPDEVEFFVKSMNIQKTSGNKLGEATINFNLVFPQTTPWKPFEDFATIDNLYIKLGGETFNASQASISYDASVKYYTATFDFGGYKQSNLDSDDVVIGGEASTTGITEQEFAINIDGNIVNDTINNSEITNVDEVVFLNTIALVFSIIFVIILFILLVILIWWLVRRHNNKKALERIGDVNAGYYQYHQNEQVDFPEDNQNEYYDNSYDNYDNYDQSY